MICRRRRPGSHARRAIAPRAAPSGGPAVVAAFRRVEDDQVCHGRCGRPLALQGVRGHLEADFYCYACLAHVTLPLVVLDVLPSGTVDPAPAGR